MGRTTAVATLRVLDRVEKFRKKRGDHRIHPALSTHHKCPKGKTTERMTEKMTEKAT